MNHEKVLGKHLMLKGKYLAQLLKGDKTTTIRLGKVIPKYKEVIIHSKGIPIAYAEIVEVIYKKAKELSDKEAKEDGFSSKKELLNELEKIYKRKVNDDEWVTILKLRVKERIKELPPWYRSDYDPISVAKKALEYANELKLSKDEIKILKTVIKTGSIRSAALKLYGSVYNRKVIRRLIRKVLEKLKEKGYID